MRHIETDDVCCAALELSKANWVCAFSAPGDGNAVIHKIKAGDTDHLIRILNSGKTKAERTLSKPLRIVLCYEIGYDGFWLAPVVNCAGYPNYRF
jgi:transposase